MRNRPTRPGVYRHRVCRQVTGPQPRRHGRGHPHTHIRVLAGSVQLQSCWWNPYIEW